MMSRSDRLRWIFVGSAGIRAGWSALIFIAIAALQFGLLGWIYRMSGGAPMGEIYKHEVTPQTNFPLEVVGVIVMAVSTWVMSRIEGRSPFSYGFGGGNRLRLFAYGAVSGFVAMVALVGTLSMTHFLVIDGIALNGGAIVSNGLIWGVIFCLVGIAEEGMLRGYLQYTLTRGLNSFFWAAVVMSIAFAAGHQFNPGESPLGLLQIVVIGLVFCFSLWVTGSLWWAVGIHAAWDWTQSYFFGVADSGLTFQGHLFNSHPVGAPLWSGGTTGPEGSLFALPILLIITAGLWVAWGRKKLASKAS